MARVVHEDSVSPSYAKERRGGGARGGGGKQNNLLSEAHLTAVFKLTPLFRCPFRNADAPCSCTRDQSVLAIMHIQLGLKSIACAY